MGFDPITMGVMAVASAGASAFGAIQEGDAAAKAANYNASIAGFNSQQALRNAALTTEAGNIKAGMKGMETRADYGSQRAHAAGSGLNPNTGSAADVQASTAELGHLDAINIRSNAAKEAYGYQVQSTNFQNEAGLDRFSAKAAKSASYVKAASSLINGASNAAGQYTQYKANKGLGGVYGEGGSAHPNTDYGIDEL